MVEPNIKGTKVEIGVHKFMHNTITSEMKNNFPNKKSTLAFGQKVNKIIDMSPNFPRNVSVDEGYSSQSSLKTLKNKKVVSSQWTRNSIKDKKALALPKRNLVWFSMPEGPIDQVE